MSKKSTGKKGMGWFKGIGSNENQPIKDDDNQEIAVIEVVKEEMTSKDSSNTDIEETNNIFSKENQDKVSLDLIVSLENMLKDRQLILYRNKSLDNQLSTSSETISRLKEELLKKDQLLQKKSKEVDTLEDSLTNKQMSYDQLLEDYKEYQTTSNTEYEKISNQLETEINKYKKLSEESKNTQYQNMLKINELEEKVRSLEIENQKYREQYQKILDEKNELMKTINDFTERMSFSFSPKATNSNS